MDIKKIISVFENSNNRKCGVILGFEDTPIVEAALKAAEARMEHYSKGLIWIAKQLPEEAEYSALRQGEVKP